MKSTLVSLLNCSACGGAFDLHVDSRESGEVVEGALACLGCSRVFPVSRGIPRFLPEALSKEQMETADAFGYEWTNYSTLTEADRREFLGWISPLRPADFRDKVVLDGGCGKGRHIYLAAQFGAREVVGIDLSSAVEAAYRNTKGLPNVHVIQADIHNLPFAAPFDLAYSIGVLHHLPVPKEGFLALSRHVKPGGRISAWVYGKEGNAWIENLVDPVRKNVTSRLPRAVTRCLAFPPALLLYAALKLLYRPARSSEWLKRLLPYSDYICSISDYSFAENFWNVFDQLVAPTAYYHSREEVMDWFHAAKIKSIEVSQHNSNSWRGTGVTVQSSS